MSKDGLGTLKSYPKGTHQEEDLFEVDGFSKSTACFTMKQWSIIKNGLLLTQTEYKKRLKNHLLQLELEEQNGNCLAADLELNQIKNIKKQLDEIELIILKIEEEFLG